MHTHACKYEYTVELKLTEVNVHYDEMNQQLSSELLMTFARYSDNCSSQMVPKMIKIQHGHVIMANLIGLQVERDQHQCQVTLKI